MEEKNLVLNSQSDNNTIYSIDQEIEVTPTSFKEYGVFCDCKNGYKGLIHISNITLDYVKNVSDYFEINEPVKVKIIGIKEDKKQLELSTKVFDLKSKIIRNENQKDFKI